jgi:hypothetical protein
MISLQEVARATGGEVSGRGVRCPGPGHTAADRSLKIFLTANGDDIVVHSFSGDDPIECKDYARQKCGLDPWRPQPKRNAEWLGSRGRANGHQQAAPEPSSPPPQDDDADGSDLPPRTPPNAEGKPRFFQWGDDGPPRRDEIRRHVYKRDGSPVRIKVKQAGGYVQWFRVCSGGATGWQAKKPDGYMFLISV